MRCVVKIRRTNRGVSIHIYIDAKQYMDYRARYCFIGYESRSAVLLSVGNHGDIMEF